jgi:beta-fructofuranosidase
VPLHGSCGIKVRVSPDGAEQTIIAYDRSTQAMLIDTAQSSVDGAGWRPYPMDFWRGVPVENLSVQHMPLALNAGELLTLRIFVDRSILEVFINNRHCMTQRIYPRRADSTGVCVFSEGTAARVLSLDAWEMQDVNGEANKVYP